MLTLPRFGRFQRCAAIGVLAATASLLASSAGFAAEPGPDTLPLAVPALEGNDAYDQAEALTKALRNAVRALPGWSLAPGDFAVEVLMLSMKSPDPPDASCQSRIADEIKADRYIWGGIKKKGANVVGELNLWTRGRGTTKIPLEYSANLTEAGDDSLKRVAVDAIQKLTGGPPKGGLKVAAGGLPAQVFVDGQPIGAIAPAGQTFQIPAGPHKITIKASGYVDSENDLSIKPNGTSDLNVSLVKDTGGTPTNWRRVGGYGLVGLGAGLAIGGAIAGAQTLSIGSDLQKRFASSYPNQDICVQAAAGKGDPSTVDAANKDCNSGKTFQTLQFVFFPAAAVSVGAGIFLLATSGLFSSSPKTTGFTIEPSFGPTAGKVDVTYRF